MATIIRFGESLDNPENKWYETSEGVVKCDEKIIDKLWTEWVCCTDSHRIDKEGETIFEFGSPFEIDL
jgi:hypothetical protein